MKLIDDKTTALHHILQCRVRGYECWTSFTIDLEKLEAKRRQIEEQFGTRLPPWKRQDRKQMGLPTGVAVAVHVTGEPMKRQVVVLATDLALRAPAGSPWTRERWRQNPPEVDCFVMVKEPRVRGDFAWTWKLQERTYQRLAHLLTTAVKRGDAHEVDLHCRTWVRLFPMVRGVRRQMRGLIRSAEKLWTATQRREWPTLTSDLLPAQIGFRPTPNE
ncbi:MAG: hypothetical protein ACK4R2_11355 [Roseateles sp.]